MTLALIVTTIDFVVDYFVFSYQRGTLYIARTIMPGGDMRGLATIQAKYSPTWLGIVAILNYITLAIALYYLWQIAWWYAAGYLFIRLILSGLLPTFDKQWAKLIENIYHTPES